MRSSQFFHNRLRASPHVYMDKNLPKLGFAPMYMKTKTSQVLVSLLCIHGQKPPKLGFAPMCI